MPRVFLCWTAWLAGTSWSGMTLMQAGWFSGTAALGTGVLCALLTALGLRGAAAPRSRGALGVAALALILCATLLPTVDTTLLSQDASLHRAAGRWLASTGTLAVADPSIEVLEPEERLVLFSGGSISPQRLSLVRLPGGLVVPDFAESTAYPSFSHLLSVWVAIAYDTWGLTDPANLGLLFAFSAWWAIGLLAWRDGGLWAALGALGLLATWLPEHWFGRFLMPEILTQALVWSGLAAARFSMDAAGFDRRGFAPTPPREGPMPAPVWVAGALAGFCLGLSTFARLEQFWVFVPALLLVRVVVAPRRWVLPPGALIPLVATAAQGIFHLWWIPTDYGNRILRSAQDLFREFVLFLFELTGEDGYRVTFLLNRVLPVLVVLGTAGLLFWGWRLQRRQPGSLLRPLLASVAALWVFQLYWQGWPEHFSVLESLAWYVPGPVWGAILLATPGLFGLAALEYAVMLEALDQVLLGRVTPEHIWASRRLVTVALPILALVAVRGGFRSVGAGRARAYLGRGLIVAAIALGAFRLSPIVGTPFQARGEAFVSEVAEAIPEGSTVVLVAPLDWLHLASALWLGEGRKTMVMREADFPGYDDMLKRFLRERSGEPLFLLAGRVVGPGDDDPAVDGELARLAPEFALEWKSRHQWDAAALEVTQERAPKRAIQRRAIVDLYRIDPEPPLR